MVVAQVVGEYEFQDYNYSSFLLFSHPGIQHLIPDLMLIGSQVMLVMVAWSLLQVLQQQPCNTFNDLRSSIRVSRDKGHKEKTVIHQRHQDTNKRY